MAYNYITLASLRSQIAARLSDSFNIFWSTAELNAYINEALQMFSAFSAFWRNRGEFSTSGVVFYDLPAQMPSVCGYNVQDIALIPEICYHLLEPVPVNLGTPTAAWAGTDMFTLDTVTQALQRRRDQFLADTGIVVSHATVNVPGPPVGRVTLPDNFIDIRRLQFVTSSQYSNLWRLTEWQLTALAPTWNVNPAAPYGYSVVASPPLTIQLGPVPSQVGFLDAVVVETGAALDPTQGVKLGVPDDFCWIVKWGALADLLGMDGQARDFERAQFCEQRYQLGVELAKQSALALQATIGNVPQIVGSIQALDALSPGWQGQSGSAQTIVTAGRNLIAVSPPPSGVSGITIDVVANATVPIGDDNPIQIGREQLDGLIDYVEHLAAFKMGGAEFKATMRQADNFMRAAAAYNSRLSAASLFSLAMSNQGYAQTMRQPREAAGKALNA